ncbi:hypothetical protein E4Z66_00475 [Aliishimia ponticola]|uniref:Bro-N domain-containing protein n=1 Tax=Aliishimia ponticola TaxID=2499833 RepID=A0A4S4NJS9_9RHOB|nr:hypothetical protein E4Z66_00475 [Aliishimia ponticola]
MRLFLCVSVRVSASACSIAREVLPSKHTSRLDEAEKRVIEKSAAQNGGLIALFRARLPRVSIISESGLCKLVMRSDKKEAKQFQDWVTREVLPAIRKTGTYTILGAKKTIEAPKRREINI